MLLAHSVQPLKVPDRLFRARASLRFLLGASGIGRRGVLILKERRSNYKPRRTFSKYRERLHDTGTVTLGKPRSEELCLFYSFDDGILCTQSYRKLKLRTEKKNFRNSQYWKIVRGCCLVFPSRRQGKDA